jgi:hypothetical protein
MLPVGIVFREVMELTVGCILLQGQTVSIGTSDEYYVPCI